MKKRILLTGASGFVGGDFFSRFKDRFDISKVDLRKNSADSIDFKNFDAVVHCAALVHQMQGAPEEEYFKINTELTTKLAAHARAQGVRQFIFLSTAHVFGDSGSLVDHDSKLSEISETKASDPYGRSKIAAERNLLELNSSEFKVAILRPPMVYGRGAKGNILSLIKLVKKVPFLPLAYSLNRRSLVFVGNLTAYIALVVEKEAEGIFLPQDAQPISIKELIISISKSLNTNTKLISPPRFVLSLLFNIFPKISLRLFGTLAMNSATGDKKIGYKPLYTTQQGFDEMLRPDSAR